MMRLLIAACIVGAALSLPTYNKYECSQERYNEYLSLMSRSYARAEYSERFSNFCATLARLAAIEAAEPFAEFTIDQYADLSPAEFAKTRLNAGLTISPNDYVNNCLQNNASKPAPSTNDLPTAFDWRAKGAVSPVRDQGSCGSCWAFSTVGNLEGQLFVKTGKLVGLAPQDLVDCSHDCSYEMWQGQNVSVCDGGCQGGWPWMAYETVKNEKGIDTEANYPYTGVDGTCTHKEGGMAAVQNFTCVSSNEDEIAATLIARGPLSIAVNANPFFAYSGGVLTCAGESSLLLNHAILLVGFGEETFNGETVKYWIVKNSWGTSWGEQGYVRIARGSAACGISNAVSTADL